MKHATTASRLFLVLAVLNLTFVVGCAGSGPIRSGADPRSSGTGPETTSPEITEEERAEARRLAERTESREAYARQLRSQPPQSLTRTEIAFLQLIEEEKQSSDLRFLRTVTTIGLALGGIAVVGGIVALVTAGDSEEVSGNSSSFEGYQ